jgi:hypothetical protein
VRVIQAGILFLLPLLTACGNGNDGKAFNPFPKKGSTSSVQQNPVQVGLRPPSNLGASYTPTVYSDDAGFTSAFQGTTLSPILQLGSTARSASVRIKVGYAVPANTRLCAVPFVYDVTVQETCFSIDGQADVPLATNQYTSIIVLPQAQLANYQAFLMNPAAIAPARLLFSL